MKIRFGNRRRHISAGKENSLASKIGASVFFLIFGSIFAVMLTLSLIKKEAEWYLLFFLLIPAVFILIGFGGLYMTWFGKEKTSKAAKAKDRQSGKYGLIFAGLLFLGAGLAGTWFLGVRPLMLSLDARGWAETPCTIVSAKVKSRSSDDGTSYSVDITYAYEFDGQSYRADRYEFIGGSSSHRRGKQRIVDQYKKAANPVCYVNPDTPSEAVLLRDMSMKNLFGLFPLLFVAAGTWILTSGVKQKYRSGDKSWMPTAHEDNVEGSILLKPTSTPLKMLVISIVVCLVWNSFIAIPISEISGDLKAGHTPWRMIFFMSLFAAVGIGLIGWVVYQCLALFNPRYLLMLMPEQICPGTECLIGWKATGKASRIQNFSIKLIGREEATYRQGTDTHTDKREFFEIDLVNTQDSLEMINGETEFRVPADTMHSFEADNNKIVWVIKLHGDIHRWPDIKQEYPFIVNPQPVSEEVSA